MVFPKATSWRWLATEAKRGNRTHRWLISTERNDAGYYVLRKEVLQKDSGSVISGGVIAAHRVRYKLLWRAVKLMYAYKKEPISPSWQVWWDNKNRKKKAKVA